MNASTLRITIASVCTLAALCFAPTAQATIAGIPEGDGPQPDNTGDITCTVQAAPNAGERHCSGIFTTFDGAPIDVNVAFPPPPPGLDGNFPVIGVFHGWGGSKFSMAPADNPMTAGDERNAGPMQEWLNAGYAVFSMSDRGWGLSCGATDPKRLMPTVCDDGYNHLMDTRFEVRDAQEMFEALADRNATGAGPADEGLIDSQRIGATGGSYGGGISMALAALKNRELVNDANPEGTLVPWVSEGGKNMRIAAAQPDIPWTDLAYSLMPNGHTLDYVKDSPYLKRMRIGVMKQSFVSGLYGTGQASSNFAGPGTGPMGTVDPDADVDGWYAQISGGEPYDANPLSQDLVDEVTTHHSSYYIDHSIPPAPLLISNGWTDDLFPPDEAIRFYNRTRSQFPSAPVSLLFSDHGHQRGQNKAEDAKYLNKERHAWFDHYVKGTGADPFHGVETLTQTCPSTSPSGGATGDFDDANTDLPYRAASWAALAPGEIRFSDPAPKPIAPGAGNPQAATAYDPIGGGGACATANGSDVPGTASYRLPSATANFTLMGSPTVIADINSQGPNDQIAARLLDVDPSNSDNAVLIARALYRPETNPDTTATHQVFQLHPNGYHVAAGHVVKLELLSSDSPYGRTSNGQGPITISNLDLRLPVLEAPGALGGIVGSPAAKVVPAGYELSADYQAPGSGIVVPGDTDRDGIPNSRDRCPTVIGIADNGGCPESNPVKRKGCKKHKAKKRSAEAATPQGVQAKKKCKRRKKHR